MCSRHQPANGADSGREPPAKLSRTDIKLMAARNGLRAAEEYLLGRTPIDQPILPVIRESLRISDPKEEE